MSKRKSLKFQTKKSEEFDRKKRFVLFFCSFLLVLGAVSALVLLRAYDFDLSNLFNARADETETTASTTAQAVTADIRGSANFLVCCASGNEDDIRFAAVINADFPKNTLSVCALNPNLKADVQGSIMTLTGHLKTGGAEQLKKAVEAAGGLTINKYAVSKDGGFISAVDYAGKIELNVKEKIYSKDLNLFLTAGKQDFNGESLLKYLRYFGQPAHKNLDMQAEIICSMLDRYICGRTAEESENLFNSIINVMGDADCDITAFDYNRNKAAIDAFASSGSYLPARVVQNISAFSGTGR